MSLRQKLWNKLAVEWRPDRVHDLVRTIDFDELPTHFDPYLKGLVRGRTVVRRRRRYDTADDSNAGSTGNAHLSRVPSPVARRPRRILARRGGARRLADAVLVGARLLAAARSRNGSSAARTNLCHNAIDRHLAARGRPEGAGLHLHRNRRNSAAIPTASCTPR